MTKLRFAPVIRVSTEKQTKKRAESLNTQTTQIDQYVKDLGGIIPKQLRNKYKGQEHATPEQERKILDRLFKR